MKTRLTIEVQDTRGKTYALERVEEGVIIRPPASWRTAPIPLGELQAALDRLRAGEIDPPAMFLPPSPSMGTS